MSLLVFAGLKSYMRAVELRAETERVFAGIRKGELDTGTAIEKLTRLETRIGPERRLADLSAQVRGKLELIRQQRRDEEARAAALGKYQEFVSRREDALFQDTELAALNPVDNVVAIRAATWAALKLYAASADDPDRWSLAALPALSEQEREDVTLGCCEMLMVRAEAFARPLPGESAVNQARMALSVLDRAEKLIERPTHAIHMRRAACLERAGDAAAAERERNAAEGIEPSGAFDHFLSGLERYKEGLVPRARFTSRPHYKSCPSTSGQNACWRFAS